MVIEPITLGIASSILAQLIYSGVKSGVDRLPGFSSSLGRTKDFESVSEFWYVGVGIDKLDGLSSQSGFDSLPKSVNIRGHISPFAPVIPGSPLDSLGMDPRSELMITEEGAGSHIDGMDILWNDQVFLPPGKAAGKRGFYYAGLYDRFGDADAHIPLYLDDQTKNLNAFLEMANAKHHGCLAFVRGQPFFMDVQALDQDIFKAFPGLKVIHQRLCFHNPALLETRRRLVALQVTSIQLIPDQPTSFLGTLWISRTRNSNPNRERITSMYVNMASKKARSIVDEHLMKTYYKKPSLVRMSYDDHLFPRRPDGNEALRESWVKF